MDTTTPQGALLFSMFGTLARERIMACLEVRADVDWSTTIIFAAGKFNCRRPRRPRGGRPRAIDPVMLKAILPTLENGASNAAVCHNFGVKPCQRTALYHAFARNGR